MKAFNIVVLSMLMLNCFQTMPSPQIHYSASTPGDPIIKKSLGISQDAEIDFIRWDLKLHRDNTYELRVKYGKGKPNTLDFEGGGKEGFFTGKYDNSSTNPGTVYHLRDLPARLSLLQVNSNLLHILDPEGYLMAGNGGWSYTLNKVHPGTGIEPLADFSKSTIAKQKEVTFEGRTPCMDLANQYNIEVPGDCIKLKWLLTLYRDPRTLEPTTYLLKRSHHRQSEISGKWSVRASVGNTDKMIIELAANKNERPISILVGDENVLFFLDTQGKLMTGNGDFSYTLNRRK